MGLKLEAAAPVVLNPGEWRSEEKSNEPLQCAALLATREGSNWKRRVLVGPCTTATKAATVNQWCTWVVHIPAQALSGL